MDRAGSNSLLDLLLATATAATRSITKEEEGGGLMMTKGRTDLSTAVEEATEAATRSMEEEGEGLNLLLDLRLVDLEGARRSITRAAAEEKGKGIMESMEEEQGTALVGTKLRTSRIGRPACMISRTIGRRGGSAVRKVSAAVEGSSSMFMRKDVRSTTTSPPTPRLNNSSRLPPTRRTLRPRLEEGRPTPLLAPTTAAQ